MKTYEVPDCRAECQGYRSGQFITTPTRRTVSSVINISKSDDAANLIMCTVRGVVKKTPFGQYQNVRSSGLIAINLDEGDELKWIRTDHRRQ